MRISIIYFIVLLLSPFCVFADVEFSENELQELLKVKILTARHIGLNPTLIKAVVDQNSENMTISKIKGIDEQWKSSKKLTPFKRSLQQNEAGLYLKSIVEKNPNINEAFLTDNQGANVAAYPATSDYWQGDEDKWTNSFNSGNGKVYLGSIKIDESTNTVAIQISAPVLDHTANDKTAGVIVLGVTVDYLKSR